MKRTRVYHGLSLQTLTTPSAGALGDLFFDGTVLKAHNGTVWKDVATGGPLTLAMELVYDASTNPVSLPTTDAEDSFTVDWGDGVTEPLSGAVTPEHTYAEGYVDPRTVKVYGVIYGTRTDYSNLLEYAALTSATLNKTAHVTALAYMFYHCESLTTASLSDTAAVENFSNMFYNCSSLQSVYMPFRSAGVTFTNMFRNCSALTTPGLPPMPLAQNTSGMFYQCSSLTSVTMPSLPQATTITFMFQDCTQLTTVELLSMPLATTSTAMFQGCSALTSVTLPSDTTNLQSTARMFQNCTALTTINIPAGHASFANMTSMYSGCTNLATVTMYAVPASQVYTNAFLSCTTLDNQSPPGLGVTPTNVWTWSHP